MYLGVCFPVYCHCISTSNGGSPAYGTSFTRIPLDRDFHAVHVARLHLLCLHTITMLRTKQTKQWHFPYLNIYGLSFWIGDAMAECQCRQVQQIIYH